MNNSKFPVLPDYKIDVFKLEHLVLAAFSLGALIVTFLTAGSDLTITAKICVFVVVVALYLFCCAAFYLVQKNRLADFREIAVGQSSESIFSQEIEQKLLALEEANQFFGASLKSADMFRLVSCRIREIIPFASVVLFLAVEENTRLKAIFADGENAANLSEVEIDSNRGVAGRAYVSRKAQSDENLPLEKSAISAAALKNLKSAVSVPLFKDAEVFGALTLYGKNAEDFDAGSIILLEAVATRVAPLFLCSFAFEKNLSNALTDALTELPNERGFYLVVENKIAETQRFRAERTLSILTIDIKDFSRLNQTYGHATGDRILTFAAKILKEQLREMDFLARSKGDEFLAVLPTADETIAEEVISRIEKAFVTNQFVVSRLEKINLSLNFGAATFGTDGEIVSQLLQHANVRRKQQKSTEQSKVLWFPGQFVN